MPQMFPSSFLLMFILFNFFFMIFITSVYWQSILVKKQSLAVYGYKLNKFFNKW